MAGKFIISLDYELHWGFFDIIPLEHCEEKLDNVDRVIDQLLELSKAHGVKLTFATIGFLFANNKSDALNYIPKEKPNYTDRSLNAYELFDTIDQKTSKYYFANQNVKKIAEEGNHEIGTHTFSHYSCSERGQTPENFRHDLNAAIDIAKTNADVVTNSIVFPRNQVKPDYVAICEELGIKTYRGGSWFNFNCTHKKLNIIDLGKISIRVLDSYFNISGSNSINLKKYNNKPSKIINVPASRFLRPYCKAFSFLESLKVNRIKKSMTKAAKKGEVYHLWFHPHNFGKNLVENFKNLEQIYNHYSYLNKAYGFEASTMIDAAEDFKNPIVI